MNFEFKASSATPATAGSSELAHESYHPSEKFRLATDSPSNQLLAKSMVADGKTMPFHDEYHQCVLNFATNSGKPKTTPKKENIEIADDSVAALPPSPHKDELVGTLNQYSDWFKKIMPALDSNHDGRLSKEEFDHHPAWFGKDEAFAAVFDSHFGEFSKTHTISPEDMKNSSKLIGQDDAEQINQELAIASKFVKVIDWTRTHRDQFHIDADGLISKAEIDNAVKNPSRFPDAESQRMLHFLQKDFDCMASSAAMHKPFVTTGIPSKGYLQRQLLSDQLSESTAFYQYDTSIGAKTMVTGVIGGTVVGGPVGAAVGLVSGCLLGAVGSYSLFFFKDPYKAFLRDLDATTQTV